MHAGAKVSGLPLGNAGDQVGGARESESGRKTADDGDDLPFQAEGSKASSIGPLPRPRREMKICLPAA